MAIAATAEARIVGTFDDKFSGKANRAFNKFKQTAKAAFKAGAVGAVAFTAGMVKAINAANEQELAIAKMEGALRATGNFSKEFSQDLQNMASGFQKITTTGDESILGIQSLLISMGATKDNIEQVTKATLDLSAGMGVDAKASALLFGKALSGDFGTLSRYGILVGDIVGDSEKLAAALQQVQDKFGGQAQTQAETFGGRMKQVGNSFGDLLEQIGFLVTTGGAGGLLGTLNNTIGNMTVFFQENRTEIQNTVSAVADFLIPPLKLVSGLFVSLGTFIADIAIYIDKAIRAFGRLADFGVKAVEKFSSGFKTAWASVKNEVGNLIPGWLSKYLDQSSPAELGVLDSGLWGAKVPQLFAVGMNREIPQIISAADSMGGGLNRTISNHLGNVIRGTESWGSAMVGILNRVQNSFVNSSINSAVDFGVDLISSGISRIPKLFGFAKGGSFKVGGAGGTDSQPVTFMATPGERITVETPAQQQNSGQPGITVIQNITLQPTSERGLRNELLTMLPALKVEIAEFTAEQVHRKTNIGRRIQGQR